MELIQDIQRVVLTKDLLIKYAADYYRKVTGNEFYAEGDCVYFIWSEESESLKVESVNNHC